MKHGYALAMAVLCAAGGDRVQAQALLDRAGVRTVAERELLSRAAPGAVVALIRDGRVEVEAIGHVDAARTTEMRADRLFGTGDIAQVVTALVAARLEAAGELRLDAPIRTWAADLPPAIGALTLEQLLTGTSGLDDAADEAPRRGPGPAVWPGATDRALFTAPGAIHSSSRHAPRLARAVLLAATGADSFDALAARMLFEPLGMARSTLNAERAEALGAVPGQVVSKSMETPLYALLPRESPVEQLYATAGDIGTLLAAGMSAEGPLDAAFAYVTEARAVRPWDAADSIGAGVHLRRFAGRRMASSEGGIGGYGTVVRWLPEARIGVVLLANATGATLTRTADGLLRHALGVADSIDTAAPPPRDAPTTDSAYAGTWANGDRIIVLEAEAGALYWRDGGLRLEVHREADRLDVLVGDGRIAQTLRWFEDAAGDAYLLAGDLAYRKVTPRFRR